MKLDGKTIVISGSASGLGWGAAQYCVRHKQANVVMLDTDAKAGEARARELGPERTLFVSTDISDEQQVGSAMAQALEHFGAIHACYSFAGVVGPMRILDKTGKASAVGAF